MKQTRASYDAQAVVAAVHRRRFLLQLMLGSMLVARVGATYVAGWSQRMRREASRRIRDQVLHSRPTNCLRLSADVCGALGAA